MAKNKKKCCPRCGGEMEPFAHMYAGPPTYQVRSLGGGLSCKRCGTVTDYRTNLRCIVCNGPVGPDTRVEYDQIYDPEGDNKPKCVDAGYHCHACGIKYLYPPPNKLT